jgi:hypothetical protein
MTTTKTPSSDTRRLDQVRPIILEGMPGAGKTTAAKRLAAHGHRVLGEYTSDQAATLALADHPPVDDDAAHQHNWIRKSAQASQHAGTVFIDRDWLSALAYAYSIADTGLLCHRAEWAITGLNDGRLLLGEVYVIFCVGVATSVRRRSGRMRPDHPWSRVEPLRRLRSFYNHPVDIIARVCPELGARLRTAGWQRISGLDAPDRTVRRLCGLTGSSPTEHQ